MNEIPPGWNHPDSTPLKQEEPDDWFGDKGVPVYTFGDRLIYWSSEEEKGSVSEVSGIAWWPHKKGHNWWYCLKSEDGSKFEWHSETEVLRNWVKERDV